MPRSIEVASLFAARSLTIYGLFSSACMGIMIYKALYEQENALMANTWINNSNGCVAIVVNFIVASFLITGRITQCIILGPLRQTEMDAVLDSFLFSLLEWLFNFFQYLPAFDLRYFFMSALMFYMVIFQKFLAARIDSMGQVPSVPKIFHIRVVSLFMMLQSFYSLFLPMTFLIMLQDIGPRGILISFLADGLLNQLDLSAQFVTYICNVYDTFQEEPWEAKSRVLFYVGFIRDLVMFITFPACIAGSLYVAPVNGSVKLPYHGVSIMFTLGYSLYTKTLKLFRFRAATRGMEFKYPKVTDEQLSEMRDRTCIICREEFVFGAETAVEVPRKLPCGHVFHHRCLHSWLERQQSCPTCRMDVLKKENNHRQTSSQVQNHENAPGAPQQNLQAQPSTQSAAQPAPPMTLKDLIHRFQESETAGGVSTAAESAHDFLKEVRPELADQLVDKTHSEEPNDSSESVREAVRRATLQRFSQDTRARSPKANHTSPVLIPLFDPAKIPDFASKHQSHLPYPLADWVSTTAHTEPASGTESTAAPPDTDAGSLMQEKLAALQEAEALIERAKTQLTTLVGPPPTQTKGKAREPSS